MSPALLPDLMPTTFRADLGVLVSRWAQQPPATQLQPLYEELAAMAVQHQARYWLQDIRHRVLTDPDITSWLLATYLPGVAARLGGRLYLAYLASPALLSAVSGEDSFMPPEAYRALPFTVALFGAEGEAYQWLEQAQTQESQ